MQPAFHRARVARYATTIVAETERVANAWNGVPFDAGSAMATLTLAAVGATLFGADLRDEARGIADVLARVLARGTSLAALLAFAAPFLGPLHRLFPRRASILFPRERAELDAIVAPIVKRRHDAAGDDLLSLLLAARDGASALDDEAIRNEVVMLILAGHETTANALTWTWYLLAQHPDVEARVHAEVDAVLGDRRAPAFEDVPNLPYVARVFDVVLRLYPPAGAFARRPLRATELGGYAIPKLASVYVSPFITQRNARSFPNPLAFDPDRAAPQQRFAYFPFGGGSKMCIGEPFARMEAVLALATLARRFRFEAVEAAPVGIASATLRPARPIRLQAVPRTARVVCGRAG
jgi:cytochrome P450